MILGVIVACEIGFWIAILSGLAARYLLGRKRLGAGLLVAAPVVDLVLLGAVGLDLRSGASATFFHGLAALYVGVSVMYGHAMVRWADVRFAHRFADGPRPERKYGAAYAKACWRDLARTVGAAAIAALILAGLIAWVGHPERTQALSAMYRTLAIVVTIEALWAASYTLWPRTAPRASADAGRAEG